MTSTGKKAQRRAARIRAAQARKRRRRNTLIAVLAVVVITILILLLLPSEPEELAGTETFPNQGREHLDAGDPAPVYNSSPATSGPHSASAAACGVYREEIPDVVQVHNLEHGTVVIQYQPGLADEDRATLEAFAREKGTHILVAPRADLANPVTLTAWTRMLRLDGVDVAVVEAFYDRWARLGPEVGVPCPFAIDQST